MPDDWDRLGHFVLARRVELGYRNRAEFADALGISLRTLGDVEKGRRANYEAATIAAIENVLGWETGSVAHVIGGGDPILRPHAPRRAHTTAAAEATTGDEAIVRVMRSGLSDERKRRLVRMLIAEREAADRQRVEHAEQLIRLLENNH